MDDYWGIDSLNGIILYNGTMVNIENNELVIGEAVVSFETSNHSIQIGESYDVKYLNEDYKFFYTQLPIVSISTGETEIVDEPKVVGRIKILEKNKEAFSSYLGVELRGSSSLNFPKKSYTIELWEDETGDYKRKKSLLGMRKDDDWVLDGMWNEPVRIRDYTAHEIWLEMGRIQAPNANTKIGISREYCELFVNGKYFGVYYLGELIDRKQLDLKMYDTQLEGELYKGYAWAGGVTYTGLSDYDNGDDYWNGYEAKYPRDLALLDWSNLYDHIDFVINSSQDDFNSNISSKIDLNNAIDYYIFLNLMFATDNSGKNVYIAKVDKEAKYFFTPWDMDGSFGIDWTGYRTNTTDKLLSNGLYNKLLDYPEFINGAKQRWESLRLDQLSIPNLTGRFIRNNNFLESNGVHLRESIVPELAKDYSEFEIDFIISWIDRRIDFMDNYFKNL